MEKCREDLQEFIQITEIQHLFSEKTNFTVES